MRNIDKLAQEVANTCVQNTLGMHEDESLNMVWGETEKMFSKLDNETVNNMCLSASGEHLRAGFEYLQDGIREEVETPATQHFLRELVFACVFLQASKIVQDIKG